MKAEKEIIKTENSISVEKIAELYCAGLEDREAVFRVIREMQEGDNHKKNGKSVKNVLLHTTFRGYRTGHWRAILDMAEELQLLGYGAYIMHNALLPADLTLPEGVRFIRIPELEKTAESCASMAKRIEKECIANQIDAVIFNNYVPWQNYILQLCFKRVFSERTGLPIKCILQFHSSFISQQIYSLGSTWLADNAPCMKAFDALLVESEVDKQFWSTYNKNCFFRPLPIPHEIVEKKSAPLNSHDILCMSRLSETKNQLALIDAMNSVVREVPDARLLLVGGSAQGYGKKCENAVRHFRLEQSVIFKEFVSGEEKDALFEGAGLFAYASRFEGYPIVLAEAKSHGLPLVMYDIPNITMEDGGEENGTVIVEANDVAALSDEIVRVLKDKKLRKRLGENARAHIRSIYDFDVAALWEKVFESSVSDNRPGKETLIARRINRMFLQSFKMTNMKLRENQARSISAIVQDSYPVIESNQVPISVKANGIADIRIGFEKRFSEKPNVVCSVYSTANDPELGLVSASAIKITPEGFTIRVFNNSSKNRSPHISYIAVAQK